MNKLYLIFEKQWLHALLLIILIAGITFAVNFSGFQTGMLLGLETLHWFWIAIGIAIVHQVYVWFCWRTQLHNNLLTRVFGTYDFSVYAAGFAVLGISRVAVVFALALSNSGTLPADQTLLYVLAVTVLLPALYLFYSVKRYFGFKRAVGIDHFDRSYRHLPFVRQGIFRFTPNAMYVFGFFILWFPALWYGSVAALFAALFNHLYIWVHFYSTERPDIKRIYEE